MQQTNPVTTRAVAAVGVAILDAATVHARPPQVEGIRAVESQAPRPAGDPYQAGRSLLAAGDAAGAIAAFRDTLIAAPQSIDALNGIAVAYDRLGRYDISRTYYDAALAIDPGSALVANNLGYSLYLQGDAAGALAPLKRAAGSNDPEAAATARRILALAAARLRNDAATAGAALARVELAGNRTAATARVGVPQPRARIEVASNGEQRLVLDAPGPDVELAASLGDAADVIVIAAAWTDRDERAVAREAAAADRVIAAAGLADLAEIAAADDAAAFALALATPVTQAAAAHLVAPDRFAVTGTALAAPGSPVARPGLRRETAATGPAPRAEAAEVAAGPAWLVAPRRDAQPADRGARAGQHPQITETAAFDSDDAELNAFAARMRTVESIDAQAVARLETLVGRLRA